MMEKNTFKYQDNRSIVLVGMMGVGKSAIGRMLARSLNREFYDIDENIEKKYNMKIKENISMIKSASCPAAKWWDQ